MITRSRIAIDLLRDKVDSDDLREVAEILEAEGRRLRDVSESTDDALEREGAWESLRGRSPHREAVGEMLDAFHRSELCFSAGIELSLIAGFMDRYSGKE